MKACGTYATGVAGAWAAAPSGTAVTTAFAGSWDPCSCWCSASWLKVTCCFCLSCRRRARALEQCAAESPTVVADGAALIHGHISWSLTQPCCCTQKHQQKQRAKRAFPGPAFQIYCPSLSPMTCKWKPAGKEVWEMKFTSRQSPLQTGITPGVEQRSSWPTNNLQNSPFTLCRLHFHPSHT